MAAFEKKHWLPLLLACPLLMAGPAKSDSLHKARFVIEGCRDLLGNSTGAPFLRGMCLGRVNATFDWIQLTASCCPPRQITSEQAVDVVTKYITDRPDRLDERFSVLAAEALIAAWPCPSKVLYVPLQVRRVDQKDTMP
jgi:hypothetical protein